MAEDSADILVLDEPSAALDAEAEAALLATLAEFARSRTTFIVSHRFSTVRLAERIVVLESGKILEEGTHQELVQKGKQYAAWFELQARGYR